MVVQGSNVNILPSLLSTGPEDIGGVEVIALGRGKSIGFDPGGDAGYAVRGVSGKDG